MHTDDQDPTTTDARSEREGWLILTAIFVGLAVLVVVASFL